MEKIKIITDSTCDLPKDIVDELDIEVVPIYININAISYRDGIDITLDDLHNIMSKTEKLPITSQINPDVFKEIYEKYLNKGYKVISIHVSAKLSPTYQSASIAKNILDTEDIIVCDSLSVSGGLSIIVKKAADMVKKGYKLSEICDNIERASSNIKSRIILDDLDNIEKFGKINKTLGVLGRFLGLRPVIEILNGELVLIEAIKGNKKLVSNLINFIEDNGVQEGTEISLIHSGGCDLHNDIIKYLNRRGYNYSVLNIGCVVGSYTGKKSVGVFINNYGGCSYDL